MTKIKAWMIRYLDPEDILLEVIFGLLIVMTFTMAFRAVDTQLASQDVVVSQVQRMLVAAIGCTIAWGMIDAVITILTNVSSRAKGMHIVARIQESPNDGDAVAVIAEALDGIVEKVTSSDERTEFYTHIAANARTLIPEPQGITREDVYSAIVVIMSAMLATLPALIPYLFVTDANWAIRLSNLIAVAMLFGVGFLWARMTGGKPVKVGLLLATVGVVIILIAIPLGG